MPVVANLKLAHGYNVVNYGTTLASGSSLSNYELAMLSMRYAQPPVDVHYHVAIYSGSGILDVYIQPGRIETASDLNTTFAMYDNPYVIHLDGGPLDVEGVIENVPVVYDYYIYINATPGSSGMSIDIAIMFLQRA